MKHLLSFSFLLVCLLHVQTASAQKILLHCGNVLNVESGKLLSERTITVEGNKITSVSSGYADGKKGDTVIDLKDKTLLPGLMDMHVHLESETSKTKYIEPFTLNDADVAFKSTVFAERTLMAGFTTVRDLGGSGVNISLRNAISAGIVKGPRVFTAGKSIATTGGHADPTNGRKRDLVGDPGPKEGVINGPSDARKAVRQRYKFGADLIKITATGGVLSVAKDGSGPQFTDEELEAIIQTANDYGFHVAAHCHGTEGMLRAVRAGVKTIEHGTYMSEEVMDLMIEKDSWYVPTITAGKFVAEKAAVDGYYPEIVRPKAAAIGPKIQSTFEKAHKRGVTIAFGTDAGVFYHGDNAKEFGYMVEAGMSPIDAIRSSTLTTAKLLKMEDQIGRLESGMMADIIAVDDNPLKNIKTLEKVKFVMKDGKVYKSE
ncbi:MAG: amidohydrolase family protein [Bacteroidota bacterium]